MAHLEAYEIAPHWRWSQITDNGKPSVRPQALGPTEVVITLYYNLEGYNKVKHHTSENNLWCHSPP